MMNSPNKLQNWIIFLCSVSCSWVLNGQIITREKGQYGLMNEQTGEVVIEQVYDSIFLLPFDKHIQNPPNFVSQSPLYALVKNGQIQLYHSTNHFFYPNRYDEIRMTEEFDEKIMPYPAKYNPNHIDCILLRKGDLWGYIAHDKQYGFHDELTKSDAFTIIEPTYSFLQFLEEQNGYSSQQFDRTGRIVIARKDSLYGALQFETGHVVVPFVHPYPIHHYSNRYNLRGFEFLSTDGGFTPFFLAGKSNVDSHQTIINALGYDVRFEVDYEYTFSFYEENEQINLYLFSKNLPQNTLKIFNYNTGHLLLEHTSDASFQIKSTKRMGNILVLNEYSQTLGRYQVTWYNLDSKKIILFHEAKGDFLFETFFNNTTIDGAQCVYFKKPKNIIGKVVGSGADLHIDWKKAEFVK